MPQKVFKTGNSLAVSVPSQFVHAIGLHPGAPVKSSLDIPHLKITYEFSGIRQLPLLKPTDKPPKDK